MQNTIYNKNAVKYKKVEVLLKNEYVVSIFVHFQKLNGVSSDGKDGKSNGLKLEKIGPVFSSFDSMSSKVTKIIIIMASSS